MHLGFRMHAERTPNPNSIKWVVGQQVAASGIGAHFEEAPPMDVSPLAASLFEIEGVTGVLLASNFVTVTKSDSLEWAELAGHIAEAIKGCLGAGTEALGPAFEPRDRGAESRVVAQILEILDREIRPAVARDGGDVVFVDFREGILELAMQGSCSGCPSATLTLRDGIEARLREVIPEVLGVEAV